MKNSAYWMPYTANSQFKQNPRLLARAQGIHYYTQDGRKILDATAGLWCCNAGHGHPHIRKAVEQQIAQLDYAPSYQMGHPQAFALADALAAMLPAGIDNVFFTNSGSESADTALKIALAYHRIQGNSERTRLIGRERGFHGTNFGGMSVGGITANRLMFGERMVAVSHIRHTHNRERNAYSQGMPKHGAEYADDLQRLADFYGGSTIAAVIVEPVPGGGGVLVPPQGYLQRLREICDANGILLIFDEVISGFGRLGTAFASDYFGVKPDILTMAKGITSGVIPMGAVAVKNTIYQAFMNARKNTIELPHGYTCSGHPVACAAALASLQVYENEKLFANARSLADYWQQQIHSLRGLPHVIDIRNIGFMAAIELEPIAASPGKRAYNAFVDAFEKGMLIRVTGDTIALSPPLIFTRQNIDSVVSILGDVLQNIAE